MIDQIRTMQKKTFGAAHFCQMVLAEAGLTSKSVKSIPALVKFFAKHSTEAKLLEAATTVYQQNSRAHTSFRR